MFHHTKYHQLVHKTVYQHLSIMRKCNVIFTITWTHKLTNRQIQTFLNTLEFRLVLPCVCIDYIYTLLHSITIKQTDKLHGKFVYFLCGKYIFKIFISLVASVCLVFISKSKYCYCISQPKYKEKSTEIASNILVTNEKKKRKRKKCLFKLKTFDITMSTCIS